MKPFALMLVASCVAVVATIPAAADPADGKKMVKQRDHDIARRAVLRREVLPLPRILAMVPTYQRGDVIEIEIKNKGGVLVYDVDVLVPSGQVRELKIDARTGKLYSNLAKGE